MSEKQKYIDFEAYERVAEPHKRERVSAWRTAIGLQDVDGLRVSDYLKEIAIIKTLPQIGHFLLISIPRFAMFSTFKFLLSPICMFKYVYVQPYLPLSLATRM